MTDALKGWPLLHSKLPSQAIKTLSESVYGVAGLSDVNEGYLIQRLFAADLAWEWHIVTQQYLGSEDRVIKGKNGRPDYELRYYLASVQGILTVDGRQFHGAGAHDNRKLDAAFKGAATVAFKNACKLAGLTIELFKDGKAMDFIYESIGEKNAPTYEAVSTADRDGGGTAAGTGNSPSRTPQQIAEEARQHVRPTGADYADEDAVCPECGRKEFLATNGSFCAKGKGGCGWPKGKDQRGTPISYGEFRSRQGG